jgi:hypothetical protein
MTAIVDRQTLITEFEAYIKRSFPIARQNAFVQLTHDRIFRDIRPQENVVLTTLVPVDPLIDLPVDFIDVRELSANNSNRRVVLSSVGRHRFALSASQTGFPIVYSIVGNQVEVAPTTLPAEFTLWYWQKSPQLVNATDTNIILTTYPYLYLYGMLIEGSVFIQDDTERSIAVETYLAEVRSVNGQADSSRFGEAPVIGVG